MCGVLGSRFQCTYAAMTRGKGEKSKDTRFIEIYRIQWEREIEGVVGLGKEGWGVGYHDGGGEDGHGCTEVLGDYDNGVLDSRIRYPFCCYWSSFKGGTPIPNETHQ